MSIRKAGRDAGFTRYVAEHDAAALRAENAEFKSKYDPVGI